MRIAFIFIEKYPNYDLDLQIFAALSPDERAQLDTYVRTGLWGAMDTGAKTVEQLKAAIVQMLHQGNRKKMIDSPDLLQKLTHEQIYLVQFDSMHPRLAELIHERLIRKKTQEYIGFTEVVPDGFHVPFFSMLAYRYKVRKGKIAVTYSELQGDEFVADDIKQWVKDNYQLLDLFIERYDIGSRFTIMDQYDSLPPNDLRIQKAIRDTRDEWSVIVEQIIHTLLDTVPDAVNELISAVEVIGKGPLTVAECANVAVNIRRVYEKLGAYLAPDRPKDKYREQLKRHVKQRFSASKPYQEYVEAEIDEIANRIDKMINLTNKGVHEDWMAQAISIIALRSILTIRELLSPVKVISPNVYFESGLFETDTD